MKFFERGMRNFFFTTIVLACCGAAQAGRPLEVDDAGTNDVGAGHVEMWMSRSGGANTFTVAPAYAPFDGVEFGASFARDSGAKSTESGLSVKWRITPSQENGCNVGASLGYSRVNNGGGSATDLTGLLTCNFGDSGSVHFNLGTTKPRGASAEGSYGIAFEREFGPVTPHIEYFGAKNVRPTLQLGLRGEIAKNIQLDGSVGRGNGVTTTTIGLHFQF